MRFFKNENFTPCIDFEWRAQCIDKRCEIPTSAPSRCPEYDLSAASLADSRLAGLVNTRMSRKKLIEIISGRFGFEVNKHQTMECY